MLKTHDNIIIELFSTFILTMKLRQLVSNQTLSDFIPHDP